MERLNLEAAEEARELERIHAECARLAAQEETERQAAEAAEAARSEAEQEEAAAKAKREQE